MSFQLISITKMTGADISHALSYLIIVPACSSMAARISLLPILFTSTTILFCRCFLA